MSGARRRAIREGLPVARPRTNRCIRATATGASRRPFFLRPRNRSCAQNIDIYAELRRARRTGL